MSFRTVVIEKRSKLDLRMGYLVVRRDDDTARVFLDEVNTLIVENPACCVTGSLLAELIKRKIKVIFCDEKPISVSGNMDLVSDFFPFEINRKTLLNKILSKIERQAIAQEFYERSMQILGNVENLIYDLAFQNDLELETERLSVSSLLKSAGIQLKEDYPDLAEKLLTYMDLMSDNGLASVFVFVNLRSFLDDAAMELFAESCCQKEHNILLIDNKVYKKLSREERLLVDYDLCEI